MKQNKKTVKKVAAFAQSEAKAKQFRYNYPVTDELKREMLTEIFPDLAKYVMEQNYAENYPMLREYADEHHLSEDKRDVVVHHIRWWQILYQANQDGGADCVEDYIAENHDKLRNKPLITAWLREWNKAIPKFYYVGHKHNDRVLVVVEMLAKETLDVIVYDPTAVPPKKGEIVMGILLPLGDALYFPIIDFYHFDLEAREEIVRHLHHYYDKHLKDSTMLEAFIHVFSITLQIEQLVSTEIQGNTSSS